jgi:MFS family permease
MLGLYGAGSVSVSPFLGRLADRIGRVRMMKASLLTSGLVLLAYPLARSEGAIVAATLAYAITAEGFRPASLSVLTDLAPPEQRKAAFAVNRLAVNLGMSIGPAVGGYLADLSFPAIFRVDGATSLLAFAVLLLTGFAVVEHRRSDDAAAATPLSRPGYKDAQLVAFLAACVPLAAVFFQHQGALPLDIVRDQGHPVSFFGWIFTVNTALIVLFEVRLNLATSHWPHRKSLLLGGLLVAAGFGAMAWCVTPGRIVASVVVWTVGEMILLPSMSNFVAELAPPDRRGEYMGLYSMAWGVAFAIGPSLGTLTLERYGRFPLWIGAFAVAGLASLAMGRMRSPRVAQ